VNMTKENIKEQGLAHYKATLDRVLVTPPSYLYPDIDYDDAYAIASAMVDEYIKAGYTPSGKKVGLTSNVMRKAAGINEPDYGVIFHELCYTNESVLQFEQFAQPAIEAELCFKLKDDLIGPNVTMEQVLAATEYVVPSLEIVDVRQKNNGPRKIFDTVADNASFGAYVLGDNPIKPYQVDLGLIGFVFERNNRQVEVACGAAVLDHPANAVAWLANKFTELGNPLRKGETVMSGSAITVLNAVISDNFRCRFGKFGEVSVSLV
jgi:2-oxo-hept-3-ene-1,7-dioate hydratase